MTATTAASAGHAGAVQVFRLGAADGLQIDVADLGATWLSCRVPLGRSTSRPSGDVREVLLGHPHPGDHLHERGYLGCTVGRWANRIAQARFVLDGVTWPLQPNEGAHQLHGGPDGFDRRRWQVLHRDAASLGLQLQSAAGDQGFPGALTARVQYRVDPGAGSVTITFEAEADAPTPVNLSNHAYFNLDGETGRAPDVRAHRLRVAAACYLPVDATMIPTGEIAAVAGTPFDLREARRVGEALSGSVAGAATGATTPHPQQVLAGGFDHCFVLDPACAGAARPAAELWSSDERLHMQLFTTSPGLQVYSGNQLAGVRGRDGAPLPPHAGIALEPQYFPDAPNRASFLALGGILRPGTVWRQTLRLAFIA